MLEVNEDLRQKGKEIYKEYRSLEKCIDSFAIIDKDLNFVVHDLEAGEEIQTDTHDIDEWVVADNGKFKIRIDNREYICDADNIKGYIVIHIPSGMEHSLKTFKRSKYYVFKEKK